MGVCGKVNASEGEIIVQGSGRVNDLPNIVEGYSWVGNTNGVPTAVSTASWDDQTDITSLNAFTSSITTRVDGLSAETSSYAKTDVNNVFSGNQTFNDITVNGTGSFAYIQSVTGSAKTIGDDFYFHLWLLHLHLVHSAIWFLFLPVRLLFPHGEVLSGG